MTVRLYDTRAQQLRDFSPATEEHVRMYVCGPTVQSAPGVHHLRAALAFDVMRRWLEHRFSRVTLVRNVTDIDDKVLQNASGDEPWWALAYRVEQEFTAAYDAVGVARPTYEPRATGSIPQMVDLIQTLIDRGHAYPAAGDVYFDVRSWPNYGELTRQSVDAMEDAVDADPRGKRDPHDFALWKGAKPGEPDDASWDSPWGAGRPGWHIECSAMARRYLGSEFDIHGGGIDLRFPHHENELAQSSAAGDEFARYWVHNGLVTVGDQKMSKSLGNHLLAHDVLRDHPARVVRYALTASHYRSTLSLSSQTWDDAAAALDRIDAFQRRFMQSRASSDITWAGGWFDSERPDSFAQAMDDDLGVPQALAILHETVRAGNVALDDGADADAERAFRQVSAMMGLLGLLSVSHTGHDSGPAAATLDALATALIDQRQQARKNRDFVAADRIRDSFAAAGIVLEDTAAGTTWSIDG